MIARLRWYTWKRPNNPMQPRAHEHPLALAEGHAGFAPVELLKPRLKDQTSALRLGVATGEGTRLIGADPSFARPDLGDSVSSTWGCLWSVRTQTGCPAGCQGWRCPA